MSERPGAARNWQPPPRPEWLASFLADTRAWDARAVAPLEAGARISLDMPCGANMMAVSPRRMPACMTAPASLRMTWPVTLKPNAAW